MGYWSIHAKIADHLIAIANDKSIYPKTVKINISKFVQSGFILNEKERFQVISLPD